MTRTQISTRREQMIVNEWAALLRTLKSDIGDEYRAHEEATEPSMQVTFGMDADGSWSYQTGDNSYSGGAYGFAAWGVVDLYRRSNCKELAKDAMDQVMELIADEVQS